MDDRIKKFLEDMSQAISEIEMAAERFGRQYEVFETDVYSTPVFQTGGVRF